VHAVQLPGNDEVKPRVPPLGALANRVQKGAGCCRLMSDDEDDYLLRQFVTSDASESYR